MFGSISQSGEILLIRITYEGGKLVCIADTSDRFSVYLDTDSLIELAKDSSQRRKRFLAAIKRRGILMFSQTSAAEIGGPKGRSASAVRSFLDGIGNRWMPIELNPFAVVRKEQRGDVVTAAISQTLMEAFVQQRLSELGREHRVVDTSAETFFSLGSFVDWLEDRNDIVLEAGEMDDSLRRNVEKARAIYEQDSAELDRYFPAIPFDTRHPATFALNGLFRLLVIEFRGYKRKKNDGLDFCHAVMAAAYSNLAALDKHWKRRVELLPKPNGLARIFYRPEVEELVSCLEKLVSGPDSKIAEK